MDTAKTVLEVSDFPHSEIAISNILAFFLDPNEEHGLADLVLKSLLETVRPDLANGLLISLAQLAFRAAHARRKPVRPWWTICSSGSFQTESA